MCSVLRSCLPCFLTRSLFLDTSRPFLLPLQAYFSFLLHVYVSLTHRPSSQGWTPIVLLLVTCWGVWLVVFVCVLVMEGLSSLFFSS